MPTLNTELEVLSRKELAALLRISVNWLYMLDARNEGPPYYRIGRAIRYDKFQVEQSRVSRANKQVKAQSKLSDLRAQCQIKINAEKLKLFATT